MNIYLIGYRCTGKTAVGKSIAKTIGWPFVDVDAVLTHRIGVPISEFVGQHGWDAFRKYESEAMARLHDSKPQVVATGGGVVLNPRNVKIMKASGKIIWLKAQVETIKKRILQDKSTDIMRPALTAQDAVDEIEEVLSHRKALYRSAMDFCIDTDADSIYEISLQTINRLSTIGVLHQDGCQRDG
jgi:shikimate kinase